MLPWNSENETFLLFLQGFDIYKCVLSSLLYRAYLPQVIVICGKLHQVFKKVCVKRHDHRV